IWERMWVMIIGEGGVGGVRDAAYAMHQRTALTIQHVFAHPGKSLLRMVESLECGLRQVGGDRAGCALFANPRQMLACFLDVAALQQLEREERVRLALLGVARRGFEQGIGRNIVPQETQDRHWPRRL